VRTVRIVIITVSTNRHVSTDSKATNRISVRENPVAAEAITAVDKGVVDAVVNSRVVVGALVVVVVDDAVVVEVLMVVGGGVVVVVGRGVLVVEVGRGVVVAGGGGVAALKCCK
jgi:ABC-type amino acid transport substrate-binding protein